jgi:multidrug transporter EmrE-like cation transporter
MFFENLMIVIAVFAAIGACIFLAAAPFIFDQPWMLLGWLGVPVIIAGLMSF